MEASLMESLAICKGDLTISPPRKLLAFIMRYGQLEVTSLIVSCFYNDNSFTSKINKKKVTT